ncbi:MAG: T9SS type A sorting domain-containing protein [Ignavibacteriales bacterium]|nr:T9SS type A sorting domain-containing protein [Ignavibacteriales bacterium]
MPAEQVLLLLHSLTTIWNLVELIVDLDTDLAEFKFNDVSIHTWAWTAGATGSGGQLQLAGNDFFGATAQDQMYVDDYTFVDLNAVPVELTSFNANAFEDNVELSWITATEINNQMFEIERKSADGQFRTIGYMNGHGTTTEQQTYSYVDQKLVSGKYIYRLKQIDFDGRFEYSNEVEVEVLGPVEYSLDQNYPNPFNPSTSIKYSVAQDGFVTLDVFNLLGEKVASLINSNVKAGRYELTFDASQLASGIYVYKIVAGNFTSSKKMILLK